jgi:hypothetical protein
MFINNHRNYDLDNVNRSWEKYEKGRNSDNNYFYDQERYIILIDYKKIHPVFSEFF